MQSLIQDSNKTGNLKIYNFIKNIAELKILNIYNKKQEHTSKLTICTLISEVLI